MDKVFQLISNWLESDSKNLKTTLDIPFKECYVLFNILSFIPNIKECGVCYQKEKRTKCSSCEFVLCIVCAPKLRRAICPHCQRENTYPPEFNMRHQRRRTHRRSPYVFHAWSDNPFGPILLENSRSNRTYVPSTSTCRRCGRFNYDTNICPCYYNPWEIPRDRFIWSWRESRATNRCVCSLRDTLNYTCPYGDTCRWIHGGYLPMLTNIEEEDQ